MRKVFVVTAVWLYIFFLVGLLLRTSPNHGQILWRYSYKYFGVIVIAFLMIIPLIQLLRYTGYASKYHLRTKTISLSPNRKVLAILLIVFLLLLSTGFYMRLNGIDYEKTVYDVNRFHPYLQSKLVKTGGDLHINSTGFRNDEITLQKPPNTYRIVILGGSTAFGDWVAYDHNSAKLLQDLLNKHYSKHIEVINAAVSGYNSEQSIIDYTFRITDYKPDMVIMWHGINDMYIRIHMTLPEPISQITHIVPIQY